MHEVKLTPMPARSRFRVLEAYRGSKQRFKVEEASHSSSLVSSPPTIGSVKLWRTGKRAFLEHAMGIVLSAAIVSCLTALEILTNNS